MYAFCVFLFVSDEQFSMQICIYILYLLSKRARCFVLWFWICIWKIIFVGQPCMYVFHFHLLTNHVCISISFVEQASTLLSHLWDCNQKIDASQTWRHAQGKILCLFWFLTYISKSVTKDYWHHYKDKFTDRALPKAQRTQQVLTQSAFNYSNSCFTWNEQKQQLSSYA